MNDNNKPNYKLSKFFFDYNKEINEIWQDELKNIESIVLCESCNQINEDTLKQIYLNKLRCKSSLLESLMQ